MARTTARTSSTSAKKTAARKTTSRTPRKTTAPAKKTTTPVLSLVETEPARTALPTRTQDFVTDPQIYAHHTARQAGLPTHLIRDWHDHRNGTATRPLTDGSHLHYNHTTRTLTWHALCPMGAIHQYPITTPSTAIAARVHNARCTTEHADLTHIPALTADELAALGIHTGPTWARPDVLGETPTASIPIPLPTPDPAPRALADQLTHTHADTADTQPLNRDEITAGLAARTNNDQPKEHPHG